MLTWNKEYNMYKSESLGINETIVVCGNTTVDTNIKTSPIRWGSWDTIGRHVRNIPAHQIVAYLMLVGNIVISKFYRDIISSISEDGKEWTEVTDVYHAWTGKTIDERAVQYIASWITSGLHKTVHLRSYVSNSDVYALSGLSIAAKKHIAWLFKEHGRDSFPHFNTIHRLKRSATFQEIDCYLLFGKVTPSLTERVVVVDVKEVIRIITNVSSLRTDVDWNYALADNATYLSAGVRHKDIPNPGDISTELWKKIQNHVLNRRVTRSIGTIVEEIVEMVGVEPSAWVGYIAQSVPHGVSGLCNIQHVVRMCLFINKNKHKFNRTRTVYGPAGQWAAFHYHTLIQKITPDLLPIINISFDKVVDGVQAALEDELRAQMNDPAVKLNKIDVEYPEWIKPIETVGELAVEGNTMGHCVLGYAPKAINGPISLVHVGAPAPAGATAEILCENGQFRVIQCRGWKNDTVELCPGQIDRSKELSDELNRFIVTINSRKQLPCFIR